MNAGLRAPCSCELGALSLMCELTCCPMEVGNFKNMRKALCYCLIALIVVLSASACDAPVVADDLPTATAVPRRGPAASAVPTMLAAPVRPTATPSPTASPTPSCLPPTLPSGLHISASGSYTETEDQAAGPMLCRIERGSCAFRHLIGNLDPDILFHLHKPPPYDTEDMLMHPAMLLPLMRLKEMVQTEWGGEVKLMITAAYDSLLEHDLAQADNSRKYSQHFEGRSLDLVTYPADGSRFARLCALAHCAGFDFVQNEGDHCHVSIKAASLCTICSGSAGQAP
jgi:hypothetical protein